VYAAELSTPDSATVKSEWNCTSITSCRNDVMRSEAYGQLICTFTQKKSFFWLPVATIYGLPDFNVYSCTIVYNLFLVYFN
jgi:hypothetical protein